MNEFWETLHNSIQKMFYTPFLFMASVLIALVVSFRFRKKGTLYLIFPYYIFSSLLLLISNHLFTNYGNTNLTQSAMITESLNIIHCINEVFVFTFFFNKVLKSNSSKLFIRIGSFLLTILIFDLIPQILNTKCTAFEINESTDKVITYQLIFFSLSCLMYYYQLFSSTENINLIESPSFWIITGLFFYSLSVIPFFFFSAKLSSNYSSFYNILFSLHYILCSSLFLCITKAFLCKRNLTT